MLPSIGRSKILGLAFLCLTMDYSCSSLYQITCSSHLSKHMIYGLCLFISPFLLYQKRISILSCGIEYNLYSCEREINHSKLYLCVLSFTTSIGDMLSYKKKGETPKILRKLTHILKSECSSGCVSLSDHILLKVGE